MGHYDMALFLCVHPYYQTLDFAFFFFEMHNCLAHLTLHKEKELPNDSGRPLSYNGSTDNKQNGYC